jgi:hypothetical protein
LCEEAEGKEVSAEEIAEALFKEFGELERAAFGGECARG